MSGENFTVTKRAEPRRYEISEGEDGNKVATPIAAESKSSTALDAFLKGAEVLPEQESAEEPEGVEPEEAEDEGLDAQATDDQGEQPTTEEAEDESSDEGTEEATTIAEAAEIMGVEPEVLYGLVVSDGTDSPKTVGELKDEVRELRQQVATGGAEGAEALQRQRQELEQFTQQRLEQIGQYEGEMLDAAAKLKQADKWLVALQENGLEQAGGDAGKLALAIQTATRQKVESQTKIQEHQQTQQQMMFAKLEEAKQETAKAIPGWMNGGQIDMQKVHADQTTWAAALGAEYGITLDDIGQVVDHRFVRMLRDLVDLKAKAEKGKPEKVARLRKPKIARALKQSATARQKLATVSDAKSRALRRNEVRNLPDHDQRKIESLRDVWNRR